MDFPLWHLPWMKGFWWWQLEKETKLEIKLETPGERGSWWCCPGSAGAAGTGCPLQLWWQRICRRGELVSSAWHCHEWLVSRAAAPQRDFGCAPNFPPIFWNWIAPLSTKKKQTKKPNQQPHSQGTKSSSSFVSLSLGMLSTASWMQWFQPKDCLSLHLSQPWAPRFTNKGLMNHNSCSYVFLLLLQNVTINLYCQITASRWIL